MIEFALDGKVPEGLSNWQESVFISIRPNLEASAQRAKAGMASAKKRYGNENEKEKESEKEKEIEKEKENENESEDECQAGDGFTKFWEKYPLKLGKKEARKVWEATVQDPRAVMAGLEKWKWCPQWNREKGRFVPRAARFLDSGDYRENPPGYVPTGGTGELGQAELEAIARVMAEGERDSTAGAVE